MEILYYIFTSLILVYFFLLNSLYFLFVVLSMIGIYRYRNLTAYVNYKKLFLLPQVKPISIIAPAYNEANTIIESVESLLSMEYPQFEVIVVDDGSSDTTLDKLVQRFGLKKTNRVFRRIAVQCRRGSTRLRSHRRQTSSPRASVAAATPMTST